MAEKKDLIREICRSIKDNKTFFLSGHQKPDGDTLASELAVHSLLKRLSKSVEVVNAEPPPAMYSFLPGISVVRTAKKVSENYDVAVLFECGDAARMGNIIDLKKQAKTVINIDHHLKNSFYGHINLVDSSAASNAEQCVELFKELGMELTKDEATCLYVGLMTDTGRFQYSNTKPETLRIASELVSCGVEVHTLCEKIYGTRTLPALKLLGVTLSNLKLESEGKIAYMKISREDFKNTLSSEEDIEEIVNYGLQIPGTLLSILFRESSPAGTSQESNGAVKVSIRSRLHVNSCKLAELFGGGGHKYASGCKLPGPLESAVKKVLEASREQIS